jgi:nicotinamide-nucleotide adenylyltransferase
MGKITKPVALFIGRFQPFHLGHLAALRWIAARSSKVIVAIGSSQKKNEPQNPFSSGERMRMIKAQLRRNGLARKCVVAEVTDINDNERWVAHVDKNFPEYDVAYSNNALVKRLMRKAGKKVCTIPFFRRSRYDATKIRLRMREGRKWQDRVPEKVRSALKKMNAEDRVRKL